MRDGNISAELKRLRNEKGVTQDQLAHATGLSRGTIANYESGSRVPRMENIKKFCEFFGVSTEYFGTTTHDELLEVVVRAKKIFDSDQYTKDQKESLYKEMTKLYIALDEKDGVCK